MNSLICIVIWDTFLLLSWFQWLIWICRFIIEWKNMIIFKKFSFHHQRDKKKKKNEQSLDKTRLRKFVIRRRWQVSWLNLIEFTGLISIELAILKLQKAVNAILALRRMGAVIWFWKLLIINNFNNLHNLILNYKVNHLKVTSKNDWWV